MHQFGIPKCPGKCNYVKESQSVPVATQHTETKQNYYTNNASVWDSQIAWSMQLRKRIPERACRLPVHTRTMGLIWDGIGH